MDMLSLGPLASPYNGLPKGAQPPMGEAKTDDRQTLIPTSRVGGREPIRSGIIADTHSLTSRMLVGAWGVSVFFHVAFFLAMFLTPWITSLVGDLNDLPLTRADLIGPLNPQNLISTPQAIQPDPTRTDHVALQVQPKEFSQLTDSFQPAESDLSIIGIGTGGGDLDTFGMGLGQTGGGPTFFGLGGEEVRGVRRIVYVVDRSGSMIMTFGLVKEELKRSISDLRRSQQFHVVFFNDDTPIQNPPKRLVAASRQQREAAFKFLETIHPKGGTDPTPALRVAFDVDPDLIYFLTDGVIPDPAKVLSALDRWNSDRRVRIYTIAFISREGHELLERIAREHNGEFKYVAEDALLRGRP